MDETGQFNFSSNPFSCYIESAQTLHHYIKQQIILNFGSIYWFNQFIHTVLLCIVSVNVRGTYSYFYIVQYCDDMQNCLLKWHRNIFRGCPLKDHAGLETIDVNDDLLHRIKLFSVSSCRPEFLCSCYFNRFTQVWNKFLSVLSTVFVLSSAIHY